MTFNNLEIPTNSYSNRGSNWFIYDGNDIALIHDGLHRYMYIKNIQTAIKFKEPNTDSLNTAFIIGNNATNIYFLNPTTKQIRSISTNGQTLNEIYFNLNDYNYLKDLQYTSNSTENSFMPTCGTVINEYIIIGGYLQNPSPGLIIDSIIVPNEALCYMYSNNGGATFQGPFFPFINTSDNTLLIGRCLNILKVNDNFIFYIARDTGAITQTNINIVQTLGVDFIGNNLFPLYLENSIALLTNYQLPFIYIDNKLYYQDTNKTGYFTYDFETDTNLFSLLNNITGFTNDTNTLRITTSDSCLSTDISPVNNTASNIISTGTINNTSISIQLNLGKTFIEEIDENLISQMFTDNPTGKINSNHFLQPAELI